jgi:fructose-bisphosphate aldolase class II
LRSIIYHVPAVVHLDHAISIATQPNKAFTAAIRQKLDADRAMVDPRRYGAAGREALASEFVRLLGAIGGEYQ